MQMNEEQNGQVPPFAAVTSEQIKNFLMEAPAAIAVLHGDGLVHKLANTQYQKTSGYNEQQLLGKTVLQVFPELEKHPIYKILQNVKLTGETFNSTEFSIKRRVNGVVRLCYYDVVIHPVKCPDNFVTDVIVQAVEVTARVEEKNKSTEAERRYQSLVASSPFAIVNLYGRQLTITSANKTWLDIWGLTEAVIGRSLLEVLPDLITQGFDKMLLEVFDTGQACVQHESPVRVPFKDGYRTIYLNRVCQPQFDSDGKVESIAVSALEVTSQALLNKKLKYSEQQLNSIANAMPQVVWAAEPNGELSYCNERMANFANAGRNEKGEWDWRVFMHPDDLSDTEAAWKKAIETGQPYQMEHRLKMNDGNYRWHLSRGVAYKDEKGEVAQWYGTATDIHYQKTFTQELENSVAERTKQLQLEKDFIETVLNSSNDMIAVFDTDVKYVIGNPKMQQQYGLKPEDFIGKHMLEVFPHMKDSVFAKSIDRCLQGETILEQAYKSVLVDRWFQNYFVPLKENGQVYGAVVVGHDITEMMEAGEQVKQMNLSLEQKNLELQRSNKELESFTYIASHDLQEPLRKIKMFIQLLNKSKDDTEAREKYLEKITHATTRMSQLIQSVLDYSRLSTPVEKMEPVDLNDILKQVKSDFELLIEEKKAVVESDELPVVSGVPVQLSQLFANLISNALKFSTDSPVIQIKAAVVQGKAISQRPDLKPKAKYTELKFIDNGIGFDPQFSDKIFMLFQRLHGRSEYSGTGVGLSIVKKIAERHNGFITVNSEIGKGATFAVYLPA